MWLRDSPVTLSQMRCETSTEFLANYDPDRNLMLEIYSHALQNRNAVEEPELVTT
jgi:hypothetical protein